MRVATIGDMVTKAKTWDPRKDAPDEQIYYIDIGSVSQETKEIGEVTPVLGREAPSRARQLVRTGDILVSTVRPNLNAVARVPEELDGATASTGFSVLRADKGMIDPAYLFHWVRTGDFVAEMMRQATGQSYPAVSDKIIKGSLIPFPPLEEQKRIAGILDQAAELCRLRTRALDKIDTLAVATVLEPYITSRSELSDIKFGDVAESTRNSFCNGPFGSDLVKSDLQLDGVPVIYIRDIASGRYVRKSEWHVSADKAKALSACKVSEGDVLLAKVGDPPCTAALYPMGSPNAIITQDVIRIRVSPSKANPVFLVHFLNSEVGRRVIAPIIVQATRARVSLKDLKAVTLSVPNVGVQDEVARVLHEIGDQRERAKEALDSQQTLFVALQNRAFRGEL